MKVLMTDDRFNRSKIGIGCHSWVGKHILGIEDVESLVLHRPHIEVLGGNNHEALKI